MPGQGTTLPCLHMARPAQESLIQWLDMGLTKVKDF